MWVWVSDDNNTAKVYFKVARAKECELGMEDEEESQVDLNATLVCPTVTALGVLNIYISSHG
jgi:hypothetical protein